MSIREQSIVAACQSLAVRVLQRIFVDSTFWSRYWDCHRLPERSFRVAGRQFHVCARCTGLAVGLALSPLLVPFRFDALSLFACSLMLLAADGGSQALNLRTSNNWLRLTTGLLAGVLFLPFSAAMLRRL